MITTISPAHRNTSVNNTRNKFGAKTMILETSLKEIREHSAEDKIIKAISSKNRLVRAYGHVRRFIHNILPSNQNTITSTGGKVFKYSGLNGLRDINF